MADMRMTTSDATRCAKCGGPFGGYRVLADGLAFHQGCAIMSYPSRTPEDYSRASDEIIRLRAALTHVIEAYDFCSADPADRGYSTLDSAISDARGTLAKATSTAAHKAGERT